MKGHNFDSGPLHSICQLYSMHHIGQFGLSISTEPIVFIVLLLKIKVPPKDSTLIVEHAGYNHYPKEVMRN